MSAISLEDVYSRISSGEVKSLNLILKADVQGSIEAIRQALEKLSTDKVRIRFIHTGSGNVTESDVLLAAASGAIILGFTVRSEGGAEPLAARQGIQIRYYDIIYRIVEDVEKALQGILEPEYREVVEGRAEVRQIFPGKKELKVAGCMVAAGKVTRGATARVIRGGNAIYNGKVEGMRRFKDEVNEVAAGFECGIRLERFNDIQEGDVIETVRMQRV
jgi:translation initiation factor IF-2